MVNSHLEKKWKCYIQHVNWVNKNLLLVYLTRGVAEENLLKEKRIKKGNKKK